MIGTSHFATTKKWRFLKRISYKLNRKFDSRMLLLKYACDFQERRYSTRIIVCARICFSCGVIVRTDNQDVLGFIVAIPDDDIMIDPSIRVDILELDI